MVLATAPGTEGSASERLARELERMGCVAAFGVLGGAIAPFARALSATSIPLVHVRHEGGAGFAAIEASIATGRPAIVFATTGPGLTNCITGMAAARRDGAHVVFVTGSTAHDQIGRFAFQETSLDNGLDQLARELVSYATSIQAPNALDRALRVLARGFAQPDGFTAHLAFPLSQQQAPARTSKGSVADALPPARHACPRRIELVAERVRAGRTVIWLGFGARSAAAGVRELVERTEAVVMASPRGKGIFPEDDPRYLGVTGLGGHDFLDRFREIAPDTLLVLGTRMGEMSSFWDARLVEGCTLVHVDVDARAFGAAFPQAHVIDVQAEIGGFCEALLAHLPARRPATLGIAHTAVGDAPPAPGGAVRPSALMRAIQRELVAGSDATILTEAGNAFAWTTHLLRFREPGRYRVSTGFGSMGMATAGVIGVALATRRKAIAVVGDGAMLMHFEISTAVAHGLPAVWIVLNDGRYGMIEQGMRALGWTPFATAIGTTDFVAIARAVGADGVCVTSADGLAGALRAALAAPGPFVVDVRIDPHEQAPFGMRNAHLARAIDAARDMACAGEDA